MEIKEDTQSKMIKNTNFILLHLEVEKIHHMKLILFQNVIIQFLCSTAIISYNYYNI